MEFYSHLDPEKILLKDHLEHVGDRCRKIINSKQFTEIDKAIIVDVSYLIAISHDFGKYTTFFQEKLKGLQNKNNPLTYHGLTSALFAFEVINEYIKAKNLENERPYKFLPLIAYFVVKRHHLDLDYINDDINAEKLFDTGFKNINKQLEDIWRNKDQINSDYDSMFRIYPFSSEKIFINLKNYKKEVRFSADIKILLKELDKSSYLFSNKDNRDIIYYLLVQLLYSVLIDSDKRHAGYVREIERKELSESLVENHVNKDEFIEENKSNISEIRNEIRRSVLKNIANPENINQKIFTITAPTGTGKTLTSLSAALVLRKMLKKI